MTTLFSQNLLCSLVEVLDSRRLHFRCLGAQKIMIISKVCVISCARPKLTISWNIGCLVRDATPADNTSPNDDSNNTLRQSENVPGTPTQGPAVEHRGSHSRASSTNPSQPPLCQGTQPGGLAPVAKGESRGERQRYCSRELSRYPSPPPFRLATKPGLAREPSTRPSPPPFQLATNPSRAPSIASVDKLDVEPASHIYPSLPPSPLFSSAPSASLDKSGFEPASHTVNTVCTDACSFFLLVSLVLQQRQATKAILMTKIIPPTPAAPHVFLPSPAASPGPSHTLTAPDSTKTSSVTVSDKGDQGFVMGQVPDSVIAILTEGFDEVDISLSKLAARVNMPFHQVVDRYHRTHTHAPGGNVWNIYARYFAENQEQELSRLPGDENKVALSISSLPDVLLRKRCYELFKAEYKDDYSVILETWREAHELENMVGGTVARCQQLFDNTIKNLDHTVSHYLFTV